MLSHPSSSLNFVIATLQGLQDTDAVGNSGSKAGNGLRLEDIVLCHPSPVL